MHLERDISPTNSPTLGRASFRRIVTIIAAGNAIWTIYALQDLYSRVQQVARFVTIDIDPSVTLMHLRIAIALLIAAVFLWSRRVASLLLSAAALLWVLVEYGGWYFWTVRINRETGVVHFYGLYGANIWDWAVLMITLGLLIWEIRNLRIRWTPVRPQRDPSVRN